MFWSDLGSVVGYEAIGLVDASLPTVAVFAKLEPGDEKRNSSETTEEKSALLPSKGKEAVLNCPPAGPNDPPEKYGKGVVFYMQEQRIVGILLWNVFNRISIARKILTCDETFEDLNEVAKLFDIYEQQQQSQDKQN